jgi:hypothetical protein
MIMKNIDLDTLGYTTMLVQYDDTGQVHLISNAYDDSYKNFQIDISLIEDFMYGGKKNPKKYKIDYFFNINKGIIESEEEQEIVKSSLPYIIPHTISFNNEITLEYHTMLGWKLHVRDTALDNLEITNSLIFYICKRNNPHFLYGSIHITNIKEYLANSQPYISFINPIECNLTNFSVVTNPYIFKSFGVKEHESEI